MNGQSRQRQHRIAENNVPAVASVEKSEEPVFEMGCKMRAAGNCGQAALLNRGIDENTLKSKRESQKPQLPFEIKRL